MRRFQYNNGLRVTGRVDKPTLQALNVPAQARLAQLRVNLQRLRELTGAADRGPLRPGQRRRLPARGGRAPPGRAAPPRHRRQARAPDADRARHHQGHQFLPLLARARERRPPRPDPAPRQGARVPAPRSRSASSPAPTTARRSIPPTSTGGRRMPAKLRFRQDPGPQNALGLVRLDMPNEHGVYMHDTPMKPLFNQRGRAFSAGCVRVQDVFTLAEWVARYEPGWEQPGRVQEILDAGQPFDLQPDAAGAGVLRLHHRLGGARRRHPVPPGHLWPRRHARRGGEPRARPRATAPLRPGRSRPDG